MADIFNNFFVNVSNQVCSEIPRTKKSPLDYLMKKNSSSFINPITYIEIEEIISSFRNGKSTGPYSIPVKLLKILSPYISQPLAIIFNASITLGVFPDKMKYAKVISIHKKGSPSNPSNIDQSHSYLFSVRFLKNLCTEDYTSFLTARMRLTHFSLDLEKDIALIMH